MPRNNNRPTIHTLICKSKVEAILNASENDEAASARLFNYVYPLTARIASGGSFTLAREVVKILMSEENTTGLS